MNIALEVPMMRSVLHGPVTFGLTMLLLLGSVAGKARAQEEAPPMHPGAVYFELLGPGFLYSLNYDHRISPHMSIRAGFSRWSIEPFFLFSTGEFRFTGFPILVNYLSGEGSSHLDAGIGIMPCFLEFDGEEVFFQSNHKGSASVVLGIGNLGYRYQQRDGGFVFRIGLTPLFTMDEFRLTAGLSLGFGF
jgi:hypothetical protein